MNEDFRRITTDNIPILSDIYLNYAGRGLNEDAVLVRSYGYPAWAYYINELPAAFFYCFHFAPDILELANIFIQREYRGKGIGGKLIKHLLSDMQDPFQSVIAVNSFLNPTIESKGDPRNFYLRNGFREIAQTEHSAVFWRMKSGGCEAI